MEETHTVYKIYCDESRQNGANYRLMGSIWIKKHYGWPFVNEFHNRCIRNFGVLPGHMKWTNVPNNIHGNYFRFYSLLIDQFFEYNRKGYMFFKTIIADPSYNFKHPQYHSGDLETGFYKLYYQLLLNSLRSDERYHIRIADRTVSNKRLPLSQTERLDELMQCLNSGFTKKTQYDFLDDVVLSIEPRPAKDRLLIQLADILMGAVGFHWEGLHRRTEAKISKVYLADYIAQQLGCGDLIFTTYASDRYFNIFHLRPR